MASETFNRPDLDLFLVEQKTQQNVTIAKNSYVVQDFSISKSGYTAIGTVGFSITTGSTNGKNVSYCTVRSAYLTSATSAQVSMRNLNESEAAIVNVNIWVLYRKN